jgi:hypothetical protein
MTEQDLKQFENVVIGVLDDEDAILLARAVAAEVRKLKYALGDVAPCVDDGMRHPDSWEPEQSSLDIMEECERYIESINDEREARRAAEREDEPEEEPDDDIHIGNVVLRVTRADGSIEER